MLVGVLLTVYVMQGDDTPASVAAEAPVPESAVSEPDPELVEAAQASAAPELPSPATTMATASSAAGAGVEPDPAEPEAADPEPDTPEPRVEPESVAAEPVRVEPEPVVEAAVLPRPDVVRLSLHFKEESWVEISDSNKRLLFGLQRQGRRRELAGEPPFKLLIGNASGVELTVNDQPYSVPSSGVNGKVARFEISAGSVE
jgi:cytoskeleton protein RodZ